MATLSLTPRSHITPDNDVVVVEIFISAQRERIFQALTDPAQAAQWWGRKDQYYFNQFTMDVRPGGKWSASGGSAKLGELNIRGEFLEIDPPRRLAYTWNSSWMPVETQVLWELETQQNGTLVKLTHSGFAGDAQQAQGHSDGWSLMFTWLQAFAERGETSDTKG